MTVFYVHVLYFFIYSFAGWTMETALCSYEERTFVNRGFLSGPFCPIYGVGALLVLVVLSPFQHHPPFLFVSAVILISLLEYGTGYLLERIFSMRWWDYSRRFLNIKGRVCLTNALAFGFMAVVLSKWAHPIVISLVNLTPGAVLPWAAWGIVLYFLADTVFAARAALDLKKTVAGIQQAWAEWEEKRHIYREALAAALEHQKDRAAVLWEEKGHAYMEAAMEKLEAGKAQAEEGMETARQRYEALMKKARRVQRRLLLAFPGLSSVRHPNAVQRLREMIREEWKKR